MQRQIHIETSPISNTIFAGYVRKDGTWATGKQDVTGEACTAVARHVLKFGANVIVKIDKQPCYEITVKDLQNQETVLNNQ